MAFDRLIENGEPIRGVPEGLSKHLMDGWYYNRSLVNTVIEWYRNNPRYDSLQSREDFKSLIGQYK